MKYSNYIFDIGANDGVDGLALAIKNKDYLIHAFEANPQLCKYIKTLKLKLEKRKGIKIKNYKIHNYAVSNKKGVLNFNISKNHRVSSLNSLSNNLNRYWPGYKDSVFKVVKKIKVKTITLYDFMKKNQITHINHLHTDTQGHDLNVLKGLKKKINNVYQGQMEVALNKKKRAYKKGATIREVKKFLKKNRLKINHVVKIKHLSKSGFLYNEGDILYLNTKYINKKKPNLKYKRRYFGRVINNNTYVKDDIFDYILKLYNKLTYSS